MSKMKNFLMEVEDEFYDVTEEGCAHESVYESALNHIEHKFGSMAREHCESLVKDKTEE